jgi:hypothetical protein
LRAEDERALVEHFFHRCEQVPFQRRVLPRDVNVGNLGAVLFHERD